MPKKNAKSAAASVSKGHKMRWIDPDDAPPLSKAARWSSAAVRRGERAKPTVTIRLDADVVERLPRARARLANAPQCRFAPCPQAQEGWLGGAHAAAGQKT